MAEKQAVIEKTSPALPPLTIKSGDRKPEIRNRVWDYLADNKLASFPWPPHKRIPNFKGAEEAGDKVKDIEPFTSSQVLKIDPDKPLQQIRIHALNEHKTVLVPTPRLRYGFLNKITPPENADKKTLKSCATREGFAQYSTPVDINDNVRVELVIVGSVAVSPKGWRIGKGEGYSDLEYAIMSSMGAVNDKTPVVAIVHDCQVIDLPDEIFGEHDVPVDYIVTPTRVIKCENRPPRPNGIIWSILTHEKLDAIPVLRKLRYQEWSHGKDVKIAGETQQPAELNDEELTLKDAVDGKSKPRQFKRNFRRVRTTSKKSESDEKGGDQSEGDEVKTNGAAPSRRSYRGNRGSWGYRRGRGGRRGGGRFGGQRRSENGNSGEEFNDKVDDNKENRMNSRGGGRTLRGSRRFGGNRQMDAFEGSVYVGGLPRFLRVSDFKGEVRERKVNPLRVMWRGSAGFAFLNFKTKDEAEEALKALEGLHFNHRNLRLEMAKESERTGGAGGAKKQGKDSKSADNERGEN